LLSCPVTEEGAVDSSTKSKLTIGVMLIVLGLGLYGLQYLGATAKPLLLVLIGGLFLAAYFATRSYFLLVVGGITTGLGIGLFGEPRWLVVHEFTEIGLGVGFALIYVVRLLYERRSHWWPLVPALVFLLLGFQTWGRFRRFLFSSHGWPILIVIVGVLVLLGALGKGTGKKKAA
jgi:hypothetical protein